MVDREITYVPVIVLHFIEDRNRQLSMFSYRIGYGFLQGLKSRTLVFFHRRTRFKLDEYIKSNVASIFFRVKTGPIPLKVKSIPERLVRIPQGFSWNRPERHAESGSSISKEISAEVFCAKLE
jgi:hypothetical protein